MHFLRDHLMNLGNTEKVNIFTNLLNIRITAVHKVQLINFQTAYSLIRYNYYYCELYVLIPF